MHKTEKRVNIHTIHAFTYIRKNKNNANQPWPRLRLNFRDFALSSYTDKKYPKHEPLKEFAFKFRKLEITSRAKSKAFPFCWLRSREANFDVFKSSSWKFEISPLNWTQRNSRLLETGSCGVVAMKTNRNLSACIVRCLRQLLLRLKSNLLTRGNSDSERIATSNRSFSQQLFRHLGQVLLKDWLKKWMCH